MFSSKMKISGTASVCTVREHTGGTVPRRGDGFPAIPFVLFQRRVHCAPHLQAVKRWVIKRHLPLQLGKALHLGVSHLRLQRCQAIPPLPFRYSSCIAARAIPIMVFSPRSMMENIPTLYSAHLRLSGPQSSRRNACVFSYRLKTAVFSCTHKVV